MDLHNKDRKICSAPILFYWETNFRADFQVDVVLDYDEVAEKKLRRRDGRDIQLNLHIKCYWNFLYVLYICVVYNLVHLIELKSNLSQEK